MMFRSSQPSPLVELTTLVLCLGLSVLMLLLPDELQINMADRLSRVLTEPYWRARNFADDVFRVRQENASLKARLLGYELGDANPPRVSGDAGTGAQNLNSWQDKGLALWPCDIVARRLDRPATMVKIHSAEPVAWRLYQAVVTASGLLGRVRKIMSNREAWVEILTAPDMALGCEIERTGLLGVLRPFGEEFILDMIGRDETGVAEGDLVMTSGIAEIMADDEKVGWGIMPRGLPVGKVAKIEKQATSLFLDIRVKPLASLRRNETVFVVGARGISAAAAREEPVGGGAPGGRRP
jgi:hypothetical protein